MSKGYFKIRTVMAIGAMIVLAACGGSTNVPANSSVDTGTPAATAGAAGADATTTGTEDTTGSEGAGADAAATAAPTDASTTSGAATSGDTGTGSTGTTTGTATPDAGTAGSAAGTTTPEAGSGTTGSTTSGAGATAATPLTGPNISYGGISFDVDSSTMPSVTVQNGPVNAMGMGGTGASGDSGTTGMAGSGTLSGTMFTFEGLGMGGTTSTGDAGTSGTGANTGSTTSLFQPRIVVIPVSQLVSFEASQIAATGMGTGSQSSGTTGSDAITGTATTTAGTTGSDAMTGTATTTAGTTGSEATGTNTGEGLNESLFVSELSRTLASQSAFASTSMSNSMVLTRALSLMGFEGYTPAFQSNGEYLNFQNGRGVRFVTAFQQQSGSPAALNQLYYMFQGLTNDSQYYVMALMPLQSSLISSGSSMGAGTMGSNASGSTTMTDTTAMTGTNATTGTTGTSGSTGTTGAIEFPSGGDASAYQSYLEQVVSGLDEAATGSSDAAFSQSLGQYDQLIESLNIAEGAQ
jgi:hypothetical protein